MPNWVKSRLIVDGDPEGLATFRESVEGTQDGQYLPLDFESVQPVPTALSPDELVEWNLDNWGTKWNTDAGGIVIARETPNLLELVFRTPWGAPLPVVDTLGERHKQLRLSLTYYDAGAPFAGYLEYANGQKVAEDFVDEGFVACAKFLEEHGWESEATAYQREIAELDD